MELRFKKEKLYIKRINKSCHKKKSKLKIILGSLDRIYNGILIKIKKFITISNYSLKLMLTRYYKNNEIKLVEELEDLQIDEKVKFLLKNTLALMQTEGIKFVSYKLEIFVELGLSSSEKKRRILAVLESAFIETYSIVISWFSIENQEITRQLIKKNDEICGVAEKLHINLILGIKALFNLNYGLFLERKLILVLDRDFIFIKRLRKVKLAFKTFAFTGIILGSDKRLARIFDEISWKSDTNNNSILFDSKFTNRWINNLFTRSSIINDWLNIIYMFIKFSGFLLKNHEEVTINKNNIILFLFNIDDFFSVNNKNSIITFFIKTWGVSINYKSKLTISLNKNLKFLNFYLTNNRSYFFEEIRLNNVKFFDGYFNLLDKKFVSQASNNNGYDLKMNYLKLIKEENEERGILVYSSFNNLILSSLLDLKLENNNLNFGLKEGPEVKITVSGKKVLCSDLLVSLNDRNYYFSLNGELNNNSFVIITSNSTAIIKDVLNNIKYIMLYLISNQEKIPNERLKDNYLKIIILLIIKHESTTRRKYI